MMDIVILCGGQGTRLASVVTDRQKCVADINGQPFLYYLIHFWKKQGCRRFILCTGHLSETVASVANSIADVEILLSPERTPLGTAGAIYQAASLTAGTSFIAMNGDSFCPLDLSKMLALHKAKQATTTIALTHIDNSADYGSVIQDHDGWIKNFSEKVPDSQLLINTGIYIMEKSSFKYWPSTTPPLSLEHDIFPTMVHHNLLGFVSDAPLLDIGTPERYKEATSLLTRTICN